MKWVKLGDYIEQRDERNAENKYGVENLRGVTSESCFDYSKAKTDGLEFDNYKIIREGDFAYNPSRINLGSIALNDSNNIYIVSPMYIVFTVKKIKRAELLLEFLQLWFLRKEFQRSTLFYASGSVRDTFAFDDMKRVEIPLPSIEEQKQIVAVWKGLKEIKEQNEKLVSMLSLLCQSYFDKIKHIDRQTDRQTDRLEYRYPLVEIGRFIQQRDERNSAWKCYPVVGINRDKEFMPTVANMEEIDTQRYKIVRKGDFVFSGMQTGRDKCIRIGLYTDEEPSLISPAYTTFVINDTNKLLPEFLFMYFKRPEMDRYGWFISDSSVRANLEWERFTDIQIPLLPVSVQQAIVNIYNCAREAQNISQKAEEQINQLCPALMRHVIGEA